MSRQYELILYGATGYTGKLCAEHLQASAPTDLKWAIAGRNASKLQAVADELKQINPDRQQPGIEAINHEAADLEKLAAKGTVLISCVGPFWKYGTPVFEGCAKSGTHYLDITGEVPWVHDMISRFHTTAKEKKIAMIPQSGIDSVPSDVMAFVLVKYVRENYNEGVVEVMNSLQSMKNSLSGGTAATALSLGEAYPASYLLKTMRPFALSPISPTPDQNKAPAGASSFLAKVKGFVTVPELGSLTDWPGNSLDRAIVHRSWGLYDSGNFYGKKFKYAVYMRARNALRAFIQAWVLSLGTLFIILPPARWLAKKMVPQPGEGADKETAKKFYMKYKALATTESGRKVVGNLHIDGGAYWWTGIFVAEAALEILRGDGGQAKKEGGVVTPATLGQGYVERLEKVGLKYHVQSLL